MNCWKVAASVIISLSITWYIITRQYEVNYKCEIMDRDGDVCEVFCSSYWHVIRKTLQCSDGYVVKYAGNMLQIVPDVEFTYLVYISTVSTIVVMIMIACSIPTELDFN